MKKALYIPAYSDGLMGMFYGKSDQEIAQENQEDFNKKKSLRIYKKDNESYFKNFFMLISAGTSYRKKDLVPSPLILPNQTRGQDSFLLSCQNPP